MNFDVKVKRGEIWWISERESSPGIFGFERPGIIVSSRKENETADLVLVVWCTTNLARSRMELNYPITFAGRNQVVCCNQIQMISKEWLRVKKGILSDSDMFEIDLRLMKALGLNEERTLLGLESNMKELQENYRTALQVIRQQQVQLAAANWTPKPTIEYVAAPDKININEATKEQLLDLGFSEDQAHLISKQRNFGRMAHLQAYMKLSDEFISNLSKKAYVVWKPKVDQSLSKKPLPSLKQAKSQPNVPVPDVLHICRATKNEVEVFLLEKGFKQSSIVGLRSELRRFERNNQRKAASIGELDTNQRLTRRAYNRLFELEEAGVIVFD